MPWRSFFPISSLVFSWWNTSLYYISFKSHLFRCQVICFLFFYFLAWQFFTIHNFRGISRTEPKCLMPDFHSKWNVNCVFHLSAAIYLTVLENCFCRNNTLATGLLSGIKWEKWKKSRNGNFSFNLDTADCDGSKISWYYMGTTDEISWKRRLSRRYPSRCVRHKNYTNTPKYIHEHHFYHQIISVSASKLVWFVEWNRLFVISSAAMRYANDLSNGTNFLEPKKPNYIFTYREKKSSK